MQPSATYVRACTHSHTYVGASSINESLGPLRVNPGFDGFGQYIPGTVLCQSLIMIINS